MTYYYIVFEHAIVINKFVEFATMKLVSCVQIFTLSQVSLPLDSNRWISDVSMFQKLSNKYFVASGIINPMHSNICELATWLSI